MERQTATKNKQESINSSSLSRGILQRKCTCGNQSAGGGKCGECGKKKQFLQRRAVHISEPGDRYEQEADRIADEVMRMPEPTAKHQVGAEKEGGVQRKAIADSITPLQSSSAGQDLVSEVPPIVDEVLRSPAPSQHLNTETLAFMEPRFGHDFSQVRVHTDSNAVYLNRVLESQAFTHGSNIYFGYSKLPGNNELTAHELTHMVQQRQTPSTLIQRQPIIGSKSPAEKSTFEDQTNRDLVDTDNEDKSVQIPTTAQPAPLRLIFYQQKESETDSFKAHADTLAANLSAVKLPYSGCQTDTKSVGSIACARPENVLIRAANYAKCLQQKVEQVHIVGHVYPSGAACLSGGLDANNAKLYLPTAKVVVHGCKGVSRFSQGTVSILKQLPNASVYVHKASAEAGGPLDFYKVTTNPSSIDPKTITASIPNVTDEGIGFTPESVRRWAEEQLNTLKEATKNKDQNTLKNIKDWLTLSIFASAETAVFADTILADSSNQVPADIINAAKEFKKTWKSSQQP